MPDQPLVSIITPSYNQAEFLEATLRSVVEQDYARVEYIVCDGGSTDGSAALIREYAARYPERLAWWCSEPDGGQSQAINKGFARATGDIVAWLNSDDCYLPGALSTVVRAFGARPDAGMVYGELEFINAHGRRLGHSSTPPYSLSAQLTQRLTIMQPASFWRTAVVRAVGGVREDLHYAMDFEYWVRIGRRFPIVGIPERLAQFRISPSSKGGVGGARWGPEFVRVLDALYADEAAAADIAPFRAAAYGGAYLHGATWNLTTNDTSGARAWLRRAVIAHPGVLAHREWWTTGVRSLLGTRLYGLARTAKHHLMGTHS
jgi:glycosyltransferase involved in cell wall biosynthesis